MQYTHKLKTRSVILVLCIIGFGLIGCSDPGEREDDDPAEETCNGVDDDGDGEVDEDFNIGESCTDGEGSCADVSTTICDPEGDGTICDAEAAVPAEELCGDGVDNDCDGEIDEGFEDIGNSCSAGTGACEVSGQIICQEDGTLGCDAQPADPPEPNEVTCDGIDNDCDGVADEGCDGDSDGWCAQGFISTANGPCPMGEGDCDDADANVYPGSNVAGCNGKDNDCDGEVDEFQVIAGSAVTADLPFRPDVKDSSGFAPSVLIAPLPNGQWCGAGTYFDGVSVGYFSFDPAAGETDIIASGLAGRNFIMDIFPETDNCVALIGYDDSNDDTRLQIVELTIGADDVRKVDVSSDTFFLGQWSAAAYATSAGRYSIAAWPAGQTSSRVFRRTFTTSNSPLLLNMLTGVHTAIAEDVTVGREGIISTQVFGGDGFYNYDNKGSETIEEWTDTLDQTYSDIAVLDGANYMSGHHQATFYVRKLAYSGDFNSGGTASIAASGTISSSTDRDWMTRIQLFEGPDNKLFVIDAANDQVYVMTVNEPDISFRAVDLSGITSPDIIGGRRVDDATLELISFVRPDSGPAEMTAHRLGCF